MTNKEDEHEEMPRLCYWEEFNLDNIDETDKNKEKDRGDKGEYSDGYDGDDEEFEFFAPPMKLFKGILTPGGIFPLSAGDRFKIYILHTNFAITKGDVKKISQVSGVEIIRPFSRYRIQITFGSMFCENCVKSDIEEVLDIEPSVDNDKEIELTPELQQRIELAKKSISDKQYWLIYVGANGQIKTYSSDEKVPELYEKAKLFEKLYEVSGGHLFAARDIF